ncbi:MAG: hypothetical protein EOP61_43120 [Sphingomonadales bacterium]|nr:MAG: hypothetical protein EOP61_43120 [Sphingomonadales bacterium]
MFFVFDVSGTYVKSVPDATKLANITVADLLPGDYIAASQISACSFSEKEMILNRQLPQTPSLAAEAKREVFSAFNEYATHVKSAKFTDIRGAIAQAAFELNQRPEEARFIVLFSDMLEDYGKTCDTSKIPLNLEGIHVIAANVIKTNPADPEKYFETLKQWEATVVAAGGEWSLVSSPDQLPKLVTGS